MQTMKQTRKELVSIGLDPFDADILRKHSKAIRRSLSETVRLIVEEYISTKKLVEKYQDK